MEAYYLQRTRFESIAERKIRRRQLWERRLEPVDGRGAVYQGGVIQFTQRSS